MVLLTWGEHELLPSFWKASASYVCARVRKLRSRSIPVSDSDVLPIFTAPAPKTTCGRQCLASTDKWMAGEKILGL